MAGNFDESRKTHAKITQHLAKHGQRLTRQRRAMVDALVLIGHPATIPELLEALPDLPASTAYRNLVVLNKAGVVRILKGADEFGRFELTEKAGERHHHHIVCLNCQNVIDIAASARLEKALDEVATAMVKNRRLEIRDHRLELTVRTCPACT
jgi:Fur family ferric uptake transcriptional regulator